MTRVLRTIATGLIAAALVLSLVGTVGFSSAATERDLNVATAADERAYVGYDSPEEITVTTDGNVTNGSATNRTQTVALLTLTNRFGVTIDVTDVEIEEKPDDLSVSVRSLPSDISPGESRAGAISVDVGCNDTFKTEPLSVTVRLRGDGVEAVVFGDTPSRAISVTCRTAS